MTINLQQKLEKIERLALDVSGFISVTKDACKVNDYTSEFTTLEHTLRIQNELIEEIININLYE